MYLWNAGTSSMNIVKRDGEKPSRNNVFYFFKNEKLANTFSI